METVPPIPAAEPKLPSTGLWSRLMNVFAAPGEVFEEVKSSAPATGNWLVPVLILIVAGMISSLVIFSQPDIVQQIHEQQQKAFDRQISAGKMTQAQADQATAMADKFSGPTMLTIFGCVGAVTTGFASLFWTAFVLTRPLGAVVGDYLDKPVAQGGLALSRYSASATLLALILVGIVVFRQRAGARVH